MLLRSNNSRFCLNNKKSKDDKNFQQIYWKEWEYEKKKSKKKKRYIKGKAVIPYSYKKDESDNDSIE